MPQSLNECLPSRERTLIDNIIQKFLSQVSLRICAYYICLYINIYNIYRLYNVIFYFFIYLVSNIIMYNLLQEFVLHTGKKKQDLIKEAVVDLLKEMAE